MMRGLSRRYLLGLLAAAPVAAPAIATAVPVVGTDAIDRAVARIGFVNAALAQGCDVRAVLEQLDRERREAKQFGLTRDERDA